VKIMLITVNDLQEELFAKSYYWDIFIPEYSGTVFPAGVLQDGLFDFVNDQVEYGGGSFSYPKHSHYGNFSVQIFETHDYKLYQWLYNWSHEIMDHDAFTVALIGDVAKEVVLLDQNGKKENQVLKSYQVIPEGEVSADKSSSKGDLIDISVSFVVVGVDTVLLA